MLSNVNTWLITDTHLYHDRMIEACGRPVGFEDIIINNLKSSIKEQDILIHLGDVIFYKYGSLKEILDSIPCRKFLTMGNHDKKSKNWFMRNGFNIATDAFCMGDVMFSHRPQEVLPTKIRFNIHGHLHLETGSKYPWYNADIHKCLSLERLNYEPILLHEFLPQAKIN